MIRDVVRYTPPQQWGVLCIDVWEDPQNQSFYEHAVERLSKYPVRASVNCTVDLILDYDDVSVRNTLQHYHWQKICSDDRINDRVLLDLVKASGYNKTNKTLHDNLFDKHTVHLSQRSTFNHHAMTFYPDVHDWIVVGSAWGKCLHYGPLGIDKLVDIPDHRFYIFPEWSVQTEDRTPPEMQQIHDDFFVWAPIADGGYRLITRAQNHKWIETT